MAKLNLVRLFGVVLVLANLTASAPISQPEPNAAANANPVPAPGKPFAYRQLTRADLVTRDRLHKTLDLIESRNAVVADPRSADFDAMDDIDDDLDNDLTPTRTVRSVPAKAELTDRDATPVVRVMKPRVSRRATTVQENIQHAESTGLVARKPVPSRRSKLAQANAVLNARRPGVSRRKRSIDDTNINPDDKTTGVQPARRAQPTGRKRTVNPDGTVTYALKSRQSGSRKRAINIDGTITNALKPRSTLKKRTLHVDGTATRILKPRISPGRRREIERDGADNGSASANRAYSLEGTSSHMFQARAPGLRRGYDENDNKLEVRSPTPSGTRKRDILCRTLQRRDGIEANDVESHVYEKYIHGAIVNEEGAELAVKDVKEGDEVEVKDEREDEEERDEVEEEVEDGEDGFLVDAVDTAASFFSYWPGAPLFHEIVRHVIDIPTRDTPSPSIQSALRSDDVEEIDIEEEDKEVVKYEDEEVEENDGISGVFEISRAPTGFAKCPAEIGHKGWAYYPGWSVTQNNISLPLTLGSNTDCIEACFKHGPECTGIVYDDIQGTCSFKGTEIKNWVVSESNAASMSLIGGCDLWAGVLDWDVSLDCCEY